jgi:hypothetical protein
MAGEVIQLGLPRPVAENLIHRLAKAGEYVEEPAFQRKLRQRDFTIRQAMDTLTGGSVNQDPWKDSCGDWRCRVKRRVSGRLVRVVVAIHDMRILYLVSVH